MDIPTEALSQYVHDKGVNLSRVSKKTGISYEVLRNSLSNNGRKRDLRAGEYFIICRFLDIDPLDLISTDWMDKAEIGQDLAIIES